jgi:hypothetical protein
MTASSLADFMSPAARQLHRRLLDGYWPAVDLIAAAPDDAVAELVQFDLLAAEFSPPGADPAWHRISLTLEPGAAAALAEAGPCTVARPLPDPASPLVTDAASGARPDDDEDPRE